ncbi:MerR family transcriptional regulator [Lysinibacillus sphaericus]|uniref:MerR family transcriptional regulator n=1 Tax=Lysinibacillus sphaericus TaxID=1421 RepID=UPI0002F9B3D5|nr:helix-turn-helix domain-containing protein [Lysinibacillus sphaericus]
MKNRFSIGEMAKLHKTTIKTLRYYDEIDLLKPMYTDKNNGYRYYSTEQFEQLNTIHYLKELGFSLKEIKGHFGSQRYRRLFASLRGTETINRGKNPRTRTN